MSVFTKGSLGCLLLLGVACSGNDNRTKLDWQVVEDGDPNDRAPAVAGVKVCVDGHADIACVTTDKAGHFSLGDLPAATELVLVLEKEGYTPALKPIKTTYEDIAVPRPITMSKVADVPTNLGFDVDTKGAGSLDFFVVVLPQDDGSGGGPLPGATVALSPGAERGPVYFATPDVLDPTLTATLSFGGNFELRTTTSGRFFNVPPGDYTVTFTAPPKYTCTTFSAPNEFFGFPLADALAVHVPVRAGYNTANIGVSCAPDKKK